MSDDESPAGSSSRTENNNTREAQKSAAVRKKEALFKRLRASSVPEGCGDDGYASDQAVQHHLAMFRESLRHDLTIKPSFTLWGKLHSWTVAQAILLLCDLNPDKIDLGRIYTDLDITTEAMGEEQFSEFDELARLLIDEYLHKRHGSELSHLENHTFVWAYTDTPLAFVKWAQSNGIPVPEKLMAAVDKKSKLIEGRDGLHDLFLDASTKDNSQGAAISEESLCDSKLNKPVSIGNAKTLEYKGRQVKFPTGSASVTEPATYCRILDYLAFWSEAKEALIKEGKKKASQEAIAGRLVVLLKARGEGEHSEQTLLKYYKQVKSANPKLDFLFKQS